MIYFDNSATTKIAPEVLDTYNKVSEQVWGNPSSLNNLGEVAHNLLEQSRQQIASLLNVLEDEILFTGSGTEGDNWVIKGTAMAKMSHGKHLITTTVEHPAVMNTMAQLEQLGFEVTYLPVDDEGRINVEDLKAALRSDTILVSVMAVNNEIGTVQPLVEIGNVLKDYPTVHFHVDAVQAIGKGVQEAFMSDRVDFVTFSGHKFHAPRGVGFIYSKRGRHIEPLLTGGGQEHNLRSGTENVPAIAGMSKALRLLLENETEMVTKQKTVKEAVFNHISEFGKITTFSKMQSNFAPHILCFAIEGVRGESIVHAFESEGIYISTTSACSSKKNQASGTLLAMNVPEALAKSAVRISFDENNTLEEAKEFNRVFDILYHKFEKINSK
ncbi:cysteine desulfurase family protein [Dellaglioa algida]|uniref:Aminotransferase V n=1 Tax=Dellaglioa algida TaxID=105612 RepID=A0A5C6MCU0_9LACO|nr:cysteine desulfurase family protein [Dellaglioa algida]MDK1717427.1 cysteine desulfurase [Dellaglioa algida]MDK1720698.1 cysteine desulfurase [Dellaglioa algida]MDK1722369.1 cysteine desulfurase [Dellaglioa algida]MDK1723993.1 cysteine desulfurase [Dellaglioa algida]MDK1725572.1 cysteine desulfurase [Dellaglioa algida]